MHLIECDGCGQKVRAEKASAPLACTLGVMVSNTHYLVNACSKKCFEPALAKAIKAAKADMSGAWPDVPHAVREDDP